MEAWFEDEPVPVEWFDDPDRDEDEFSRCVSRAETLPNGYDLEIRCVDLDDIDSPITFGTLSDTCTHAHAKVIEAGG